MCFGVHREATAKSPVAPDILESEIAMATTFAEVEKLTFDFWAVIEPMLRGVRQPAFRVATDVAFADPRP